MRRRHLAEVKPRAQTTVAINTNAGESDVAGDAPDSGQRNWLFQSIAFSFKKMLDLREGNAFFA